MLDIASLGLRSQPEELECIVRSGNFYELGRGDALAPLLGGSTQKYLHTPTLDRNGNWLKLDYS